jgi:hypothetical protein
VEKFSGAQKVNGNLSRQVLRHVVFAAAPLLPQQNGASLVPTLSNDIWLPVQYVRWFSFALRLMQGFLFHGFAVLQYVSDFPPRVQLSRTA